MTHYKVLGVDRDATQSSIKKAYRRLVLTHHPDKGGSKEDFQQLKEAYDTLNDLELRAQYDHSLDNPFSEQEAWAQAQAQAQAYAQWQYEQQYNAFRQLFGQLEQVQTMAWQWQFGQPQVWEQHYQQQPTAQCKWAAQQLEDQMRLELERAIQLEKLRQEEARQEEQRQKQLLQKLEEVARLELEVQKEIRKKEHTRQMQEKQNRELREEQVRQENELQKRQQEAKENRQREQKEEPRKKLQTQKLSHKEQQQEQPPITFGKTKTGAPCKSCIQQGRYCTRHLHQDPQAAAKISKVEPSRKNRAFGVDISNCKM